MTSISNYNKDDESGKGLKFYLTETADIFLNITGRNFVLNTVHVSFHSDGKKNSGNFEIRSGDDEVHTDQYLILGKKGTDNI